MKRTQRGDDLKRAVAVAPAPLARDLDRCLVGFRAGVAEEDTRWKRELHQPARQLDLRFRVVEVGRVDERLGLACHGRRHLRVGVAEQVDGDAGDQVEVLVAGVVVDEAALPANERNREPAAGLHEVLVSELGRAHGSPTASIKDASLFTHPLPPTHPIWGIFVRAPEYGGAGIPTTLLVNALTASPSCPCRPR